MKAINTNNKLTLMKASHVAGSIKVNRVLGEPFCDKTRTKAEGRKLENENGLNKLNYSMWQSAVRLQ